MPRFICVDGTWINIDAIEMIEHVDANECNVFFASGNEETLEVSAVSLVHDIERKEESLGNRY